MNITDVKNRFDNEVASLSNSKSRKRMSMLFDNGIYTEIDRFIKNNENECEVVAGYGFVGGMPVYAYSQSIDVLNGAMGKVQAAKIAHVYELATKTGAPVVAVFDSNGAHLDEGIDALEAYGKLIKAAGNISGVVPQISVVAGPCVGSAAVLAALSDVLIMVNGADFYITSSNNENSVAESVAALVAKDDEAAIQMAADVLAFLPSNNLTEPVFTEQVNPKGGSVIDSVIDAESFYELWQNNGAAIKVGFARVGGAAVGVVASNPDADDGYFCPCAAKKAAKFVRLCDAFSIPVITLVDSLGIHVKDTCCNDGGVKAVSMLTSAYSEATTPKITVVTGNAYAGAYIAFVSEAAGPDIVFAWDSSAIGTVEPMTAVQFLYKDRLNGENRSDLEKEYAAVKCSPFNAAALGYINDVITADETAEKIISALDVLSSKRVSTLNKKHTNIPL